MPELLTCWEDKRLKDFLLDKLVGRFEGGEKLMDRHGEQALPPTMMKFHRQLGSLLNRLENLPFCGEAGTEEVERNSRGNIKQRDDGSKGKKGESVPIRLSKTYLGVRCSSQAWRRGRTPGFLHMRGAVESRT